MSAVSIEALKEMNLVEFLSRHYGLRLRPSGGAYACRSPFTGESNPSFFVRLVGGHWVFKDFSIDAGGTIFDFVQLKENLSCFSEALAFVRKLLGLSACDDGGRAHGEGKAAKAEVGRPYDVAGLYRGFRRKDASVCREYLLGRGISPELVDGMISDGTVVHNEHDGRSYCCFAVRDDAGVLRCLDNHAVDGGGKFVLGPKSVFTREWEEVKRAKRVFVSEGIIDYLSIKTLERDCPPGLALLGNQLCFEPGLLDHADEIVSAMDDDQGGDGAAIDLKILYPEKEVRIYDLEGHKDPNELLVAVRSGKGRKLSPERRLQLYREFQQSENKTELARRWGIDRSYLYEVVRDCEQTLVEAYSGRKPGRPPKGTPATIEDAVERIKELEEKYEREATEREKLYCRSEFLAIRLKWSEIEAAELRGEAVGEEKGQPKKPQVKKKKSRRHPKR
jgi:DNA primase